MDNMHKPVLAQHAAFLTRINRGDAEWIRDKFYFLQTFINNYKNHHKHRCGLYFWQNDHATGVDNDPCTYFRPARSSGSIYLNCLMYKELEAIAYLCDCLNFSEIGKEYRKDAETLKAAILENCWDDKDGFFYSVDLNLLPNEDVTELHNGQPRDWDCLIQRIGKYGFIKDAVELAEKTIRLFGRDFERFGALHEYYQPENGEPILNRGF